MLTFVTSFVLIRHKLDDNQPTPTDTLAPSSQAPLDAERGHSYDKQRSSAPLDNPSTSTYAGGGHSSSFSFSHPGVGPLSLASIFSGSGLLQYTLTAGVIISRTRPLRRARGTSVQDQDEENTALLRLLYRSHIASILFAQIGFMLIVVGFIAYAREVLANSVSIFVSACVGASLITALVALN